VEEQATDCQGFAAQALGAVGGMHCFGVPVNIYSCTNVGGDPVRCDSARKQTSRFGTTKLLVTRPSLLATEM